MRLIHGSDSEVDARELVDLRVCSERKCCSIEQNVRYVIVFDLTASSLYSY